MRTQRYALRHGIPFPNAPGLASCSHSERCVQFGSTLAAQHAEYGFVLATITCWEHFNTFATAQR